MTPAPQHTDRKDSLPRLTPLACLYVPVIMALVGLARFAVWVGIIRFEPPTETPQRLPGMFNNRYFRRAQAACIRKELTRIKMTGQPMTGLNYFPRRYAFMGYENLAADAQTFQQYLDQCVRKFGLSRTVLFGLSPDVRLPDSLSEAGSSLFVRSGLRASLNLAAPSDPDPP